MTEDDMNVFFLAFGQLREAINSTTDKMRVIMMPSARFRSKYTK